MSFFDDPDCCEADTGAGCGVVVGIFILVALIACLSLKQSFLLPIHRKE